MHLIKGTDIVKKILFLSTVLGSLWLMVWLATPLSSMSVQENIRDENGIYSWEQWCWHTYRIGGTRKIKKADFSVVSEGHHGRLETNLCKGFLE